MRAMLISALALASSQTAAQTIDLVSKDGTFKPYAASVPIPSEGETGAKEIQLDFLMSEKGKIADLQARKAGKRCQEVEIRPGLFLIIGCEPVGGPLPPVSRPIVIEVANIMGSSTTAGDAPSVAVTVREIDLKTQGEGNTFQLVPNK